MIWWIVCCMAFADEASRVDDFVHPWFLNELEERQDGMQRYLSAHYGPNPPKKLEPKMVVVHWTGSGSAKSTWNTFSSATLRGRRDIKGAGDVNVSAHYLVDRDGTIFQLLPEDHFARHCIGVNHVSIGIENVGGTSTHPLTEAQVLANARLIEVLKTRHEIDVLIGHYEILHFESHPYFHELDSNYRSIKVDPGEEFMKRLRAEIVTVESLHQSKP